MLDADTKRKIDNCRDILVGKIPDPKSQVEQITIALIYKFMDDMDQRSIDQGGKPSFFRGEFEKYSWSNIFNPRIDGYTLLNLYAEALSRMDHNPNIPQLFRDIFKNVLLPYRDPETLRLFLKEIRGFTYDHSERLGDAFEYLLSVLGSQGKAGQFRTPRHIIDFIVKVVDPQLNEPVLDPACGTAGFLISAYKHILKNNPKLSTSQKQRLINNFIGYDIDPGMRRLSLANMYLHGFPEPHIHEYDTLTSEDRWQDTFDVIMANPPFMSPKGGIRPHSRFSIQAKRSEVLFVDYIAEHLNPSGRAGVIVPEGIIFQSQNAYKTLRKMLVENYLWAVVSLPAGVFNPYSGVKTSILLMDKSLAKRIDKILFVKIENDGFDLGAQRRPIDKNDLPAALKFLNIYKTKIANLSNLKSEILNLESNISPFALAVPKSQIAQSADFNLSGDRYKPTRVPINQKWPMVDLGDLVDIRTGKKDVNEGNPEGQYPFFTCANEHTYSDSFSFDTEALLIAGNGDVGAVKYYKGKFEAYQRTYVLSQFEKVEPRYLYHLLNLRLKDTVSKQKLGNTMPYIKLGMLSTFQIPLPPLEVQETIVAEIDGYQKIIDAARQITQSYKPTIKINPDWPDRQIGELVTINNGLVLTDLPDRGTVPCVKVSDMNLPENHREIVTSSHWMQNTTKPLLPVNSVVFPKRGAAIATNKKRITRIPCLIDNNCMGLTVRSDAEFVPEYLLYFLLGFDLASISNSAGIALINNGDISSVKIPLPPLATQQAIVAEIEIEQKIVNQNKTLIEIFQNKISDTISSLWA